MSQSNRKKDCAVRRNAPSSMVPAGAPDWITAELIERTIHVWQPFYAEALTPGDAVTMIVAAGRLLDALAAMRGP